MQVMFIWNWERWNIIILTAKKQLAMNTFDVCVKNLNFALPCVLDMVTKNAKCDWTKDEVTFHVSLKLFDIIPNDELVKGLITSGYEWAKGTALLFVTVPWSDVESMHRGYMA